MYGALTLKAVFTAPSSTTMVNFGVKEHLYRAAAVAIDPLSMDTMKFITYHATRP
jgi:hypothetical protein